MPDGPRATIMITTRNRRDELLRAIASALVQHGAPEVLVLDDASTDGTAEAVRAHYPEARLVRAETPRGYIAQRNLGAELAQAPIVVSLDDDAELSSPAIVEQTLLEFSHPRVGAVAMPFEDVRHGPEIHQRAPDAEGTWVASSYIGTAHALRRDVFLALGGYREALFHQGEEPDYCLRMLDAGFVTRLGRADRILHYQSPNRDVRRWHVNGSRNQVLYAWQNVPLPYLPLHLGGTTAKSIVLGFRQGHLRHKLEGLAAGYAAVLRGRAARRPVGRAAYRLSQRLRREGPLPLDELEQLLSPLRAL